MKEKKQYQKPIQKLRTETDIKKKRNKEGRDWKESGKQKRLWKKESGKE
jgi:hypothetical protein